MSEMKPSWKNTDTSDIELLAQKYRKKQEEQKLNQFGKNQSLDTNTKKSLRVLLECFADKYKIKYGEIMPISFVKDMALLKRCLEWCDGDYGKLEDIVDFVFTNWDAIVAHTFLKGRPSIGMLATNSCWLVIIERKANGIGTGIASRFNETKADKEKDAGW